MLESHRNLVRLPLLFLIGTTLFCFFSQLAHANKTAPTVGQTGVNTGSIPPTSAPFITSTPMSLEDEPNGDDGALIKKDIKELNQAMTNHSIKTQVDNHQFYKPEYIKDPERAMSLWVDFSKITSLSQNMSTKHEMLSKSHRRAAPIKLSFEFPFYGQPLRMIIIATGGFLYVGEHLHHWLAATQNISPLMANFDLSISPTSDIHYHDNGTALVVQWQNVQMRDNKPPGNFSFQVTLHKNGDIVFVYKSLPVPIAEIPEDEHPVKVGISDAFLIDKVAFFIRRKTIFDYHRLNLKDVPEIGNQTAIYLKALPTCNQFDTCETCNSKATASLECIWCPAVKRCSNGFDRKRQEWLNSSCDKIVKSECPKPDAGSSQSSQSATSNSPLISVDSATNNRASYSEKQIDNMYSRDSRPSEGGTAFVTLLMFLALTTGVSFWVFYAYKNPHTPSGQMLIKYRPTNWRWQNAETRYTAASIHM